MNEFDNTGLLEEPNFQAMMQDKITTKITAKGEIQAEVRIGGVLTTIEDISKLVGLHKFAWTQLKIMFPNLVQPKEKKK